MIGRNCRAANASATHAAGCGQRPGFIISILNGQRAGRIGIIFLQTGIIRSTCQNIAAVQFQGYITCTFYNHSGITFCIGGVSIPCVDVYIIQCDLGFLIFFGADRNGVLSFLAFARQGDVIVFQVIDVFAFVILGIVGMFIIRPLADVLFTVGFRADGNITVVQIIGGRKGRSGAGCHDGKHSCGGKNTQCKWFVSHKILLLFNDFSKNSLYFNQNKRAPHRPNGWYNALNPCRPAARSLS